MTAPRPQRSLGGSRSSDGWILLCRRSRTPSGKFRLNESERRLFNFRYSHFVPIPAIRLSPDLPVSQTCLFQTWLLRTGRWRPHPTGQLLPVVLPTNRLFERQIQSESCPPKDACIAFNRKRPAQLMLLHSCSDSLRLHLFDNVHRFIGRCGPPGSAFHELRQYRQRTQRFNAHPV